MRILSTTLLISFMTVFALMANAESNATKNQVAQQPTQPRLATCKDCVDAGYRRGYAEAEAAALENTVAGSSSVTTPLSYRRSVYVQAPTTQPQPSTPPQPRSFVRTPTQAAAPAPRKLPSYMQRMETKEQPNLPNMQSKPRQQVHRTEQIERHAGHGHHTQAQILDCELTDSLNRSASPVTTVMSTQRHFRPVASAVAQALPQRLPTTMQPMANVKHNDHYHHTQAEKADCALTDALNRQASPVSSIISASGARNYSPVKQDIQQNFAHGNHTHHSEVERADCALTDALNHGGGSVIQVVKKH